MRNVKDVKAVAIALSVLTVGTGAFVIGFGSVGDGSDQRQGAAEAAASTHGTDAPRSDDGTTGTDTDDGNPSTGSGAVHEEFSADPGASSPDAPDDPIGGVRTDGLVPEGMDLTSIPGAPEGGHALPHSASDSLSAGPGCDYQCIASGVAYPRGFGAQLVVETKVPADLFMTVVADADDDGEYELHEVTYSPGKVTEFSWNLDHLDPGQRYYAMVAATDQHGDTSHAFGEFTTLSTRNVELAVTYMSVFDGPSNVEETTQHIRLDGGDHADYELGDWVAWDDVDRHVDLDLLVARTWEASVCEPFWDELMESPQGDSDDSCVAWNTATADIDLDALPAGQGHWSDHTFDVEFRTPTDAGGSLPAGYGDPRWFHVVATARLHVSYR